MQPETPPVQRTPRRVRYAFVDGVLMIVLGLASLGIAFPTGDLAGSVSPTCLVACVLLMFAGVSTVRGARRYTAGEHRRGIRDLIIAQVVILVAVLCYCALRFTLLPPFDPEIVKLVRPQLPDFSDAEITELLRTGSHLLYSLLAILTVLYQGLLIIGYARLRRTAAT